MISITVKIGLDGVYDTIYISSFYIVSMQAVRSRNGNTRITMSNGEVFTCEESIEQVLNDVSVPAS